MLASQWHGSLIHHDLLLTPSAGVVSAPLWNNDKSKFAGMLTVLDIIHLIQYYYRTATYAYAATDVDKFRLESLRGTRRFRFFVFVPQSHITIRYREGAWRSPTATVT